MSEFLSSKLLRCTEIVKLINIYIYIDNVNSLWYKNYITLKTRWNGCSFLSIWWNSVFLKFILRLNFNSILVYCTFTGLSESVNVCLYVCVNSIVCVCVCLDERIKEYQRVPVNFEAITRRLCRLIGCLYFSGFVRIKILIESISNWLQKNLWTFCVMILGLFNSKNKKSDCNAWFEVVVFGFRWSIWSKSILFLSYFGFLLESSFKFMNRLCYGHSRFF